MIDGEAMDPVSRRARARRTLSGYVSGPQAATEATGRALARIDGSVGSLILVEGISDQIAVESLARLRSRDLSGEGVVVLPVGGAHGVGGFVRRFGPDGAGLRLSGLCDVAEERIFQRALHPTTLGPVTGRVDLEAAGFFVCVEDLEDELLRAAGEAAVVDVMEENGDLGSFRTLQQQPVWRDKSSLSQMRRFIGAGSRRKLRYARLLTEAIAPELAPAPLVRVLERA